MSNDVLFNGAWPDFDIDQGGLPLVLVRGLTVAFLLSGFGTLAFRSLVTPRAFAGLEAGAATLLDGRLVWLAWIGLLGAALCLVAWVPVQSGAIAGAATLGGALGAAPQVLATTRFGHVVSFQLLSLAGTAIAVARWRSRPWVATVLSGLALALQAGHGHAAAMEPGPSVPLLSDIVHLLGAGAWLGGLWPLLLMVRHAPARASASCCRYYSPVGKWCLVAVLASAGMQFWELIGGLPGLVGTAYGWVALAKMALYGVLFGFALVNRYRLAPALLGADPPQARLRLARSIAVQSGAGLAVVLAAGLLSQLSPSMHTQPVWPFAVQPSLVTMREDPEFRGEIVRALVELGAAALLTGFAIWWRRRWAIALLALAKAASLTVQAVPHLGLLFIPATPTSFYRSPTSFSAETIVAGAALYPANCASCHGAEGHGDGPRAAGLSIPPADLTAPHLWEHPDGELFWWLTHGMATPEGGDAMPGFQGVLSDDDVWALIDFIRANNAGVAFGAGGAWPLPVQAPAFQMNCGTDTATDLSDLRGRVVRLVFSHDPPPEVGGVVTVVASDAKAMRGKDLCAVDDDAVRAAYAIVTGIPGAGLDGAEVLIDANGWLRDVRKAGAASDTAALRDIAGNPLDPAAGDGGGHHHH